MTENLHESLIVLNNYKTFKRTPNNSWSQGKDSFQQSISRLSLFLAHRDIHLKALPQAFGFLKSTSLRLFTLLFPAY